MQKITSIKVTPDQKGQIYDWVTKINGKGYLWGHVVAARDGVLSARFGDYLVTVRTHQPDTLQLDTFAGHGNYQALKSYVESHLPKPPELRAVA